MSTPTVHEPQQKLRPITFTVDQEPITTTEHELTPTHILELAEIDPKSHYLEQLKGHEHVSYQGKGDIAIPVHEHDVFVSIYTGPTRVS